MTVVAGEARQALARVLVDAVSALATVMTRVRVTLVDVGCKHTHVVARSCALLNTCQTYSCVYEHIVMV